MYSPWNKLTQCNLNLSCLPFIGRHIPDPATQFSFYQWQIHKLFLLQTTWTFNLRDFESIMAYDLSRAIYLFRSMYLCGWRRQGFRSVGDPDLLNTNTSWNQLIPSLLIQIQTVTYGRINVDDFCAVRSKGLSISHSSFIPRENVHPDVTNIDLPGGRTPLSPLLLLSTGSENS